MRMFRFWNNESRGSQKSVAVCQPMNSCVKPQNPVVSVSGSSVPIAAKRRRSVVEAPDAPTSPVAKRPRKSEDDVSVTRSLASPVHPSSGLSVPSRKASSSIAQPTVSEDQLNRVREVVNFQIGHEILLRHNELRLIDQEIAKCQVALEQLRRCHLIPYPVSCPTPDQVLDMMSGKGPALQSHPQAQVPEWAPPFGVVDGPYARHYAKWLIPDPKFDGIQVDFHIESRLKGAEGRTTRNSYADNVPHGKRTARTLSSGPRFQSLSAGYPVKNDKAGPCTLVRQLDGVRVKLVCLDCNRENFSSTQGFINHCRIAHKRDYKSHEEAAQKCGQPIGPEVGASPSVEEKPSPAAAPAQIPAAGPSAAQPSGPSVLSGQVHPFARPDLMEQEPYVALQGRIADCIKLFETGRHPYCKTIPTATAKPSQAEASTTKSSSRVPFLSALVKSRNVEADLEEAVTDATKPLDYDELAEDSEEGDEVSSSTLVKASGVMRVPARASSPTGDSSTGTTSAANKGRGHLTFAATHPISRQPRPSNTDSDVVMRDTDDVHGGDLSPNTASSNNAPSLVSDDGEYEDSDMASDSEAGDSVTGGSVSDVPEVDIEEDSDGRPVRHHRSSSGGGPESLRIKRDDVKQVTIVTPLTTSPQTLRRNSSHSRVRRN